MSLLETLRRTVREKGPLPFTDYMQAALYAPHFGYYTADLPKLGKEGDFVTAPEISTLFGKTLARQCADILNELGNGAIFEFGAGSGALCVDILMALEHLDVLPEAYHILEISPTLRARQEARIRDEIPHLAGRVHWHLTLPEKPLKGIVLANEVLDAMPVHRFLQTHEGLLESHVTLDENDALKEIFLPCTHERLQAHVQKRLPPLTPPYLSEVNLHIDGWMQACHELLERGVVIIIDYGFPRHEYYHPDRHTGTLMCHWRHQAHTNPLAHPGDEDITAHVDFTHVAEAANNAGLTVAGFTSQAAFLVNAGLLDILQESPPDGNLATSMAVRQLLMPGEMGELFKVMALTRDYSMPLRGFHSFDKRASLNHETLSDNG